MQIIHRVVLQLILLLGLSWASGYVISDFSDSNWSTALFLTPSGLIENFARANTLMSFYFDPARTQGQPDIGSLVLWIALAVNARAIFKRIIRSDLKNLKGATLIFAVNSVTHPLVFFGFMNLPLSFLANILLAETFAWLSEAYFLQKALQGSWQKRLFASALANLVSWQMGPVLTYWLLG